MLTKAIKIIAGIWCVAVIVRSLYMSVVNGYAMLHQSDPITGYMFGGWLGGFFTIALCAVILKWFILPSKKVTQNAN